MRICPNQKTDVFNIAKEQVICTVREDFEESVSYCQFAGKEEQCPEYLKALEQNIK